MPRFPKTPENHVLMELKGRGTVTFSFCPTCPKHSRAYKRWPVAGQNTTTLSLHRVIEGCMAQTATGKRQHGTRTLTAWAQQADGRSDLPNLPQEVLPKVRAPPRVAALVAARSASPDSAQQAQVFHQLQGQRPSS